MISVRRLVGNCVAEVMMRRSKQLSGFKNHFDNVNIRVHLSAYRGRAMKNEYIHLIITFICLSMK
jgi:hypothetical protein